MMVYSRWASKGTHTAPITRQQWCILNVAPNHEGTGGRRN
jgi:hypothetical protein